MPTLNDSEKLYFDVHGRTSVVSPKRIFLTSTGLSGGPASLQVDGSVTPVLFSAAPLTGSWAVAILEVSYTTAGAAMVPSKMGSIAALANGCQLLLIDNGVEIDLTENNFIKQNADWYSLSTECKLTDWSGTNYTIEIHFPIFEHTGGYIKLDSARNQKIAFKIRDNLSTAFSAARISMRYFEM